MASPAPIALIPDVARTAAEGGSVEFLPVNAEGIPDDLKAVNQWGLWRAEGDAKKPRKVPYRVNGNKASPSQRRDWIGFASAVGALKQSSMDNPYTGLGYLLTRDNNDVGIDLDDVRNPSTGEVHPKAQTIIESIGTYVEISPSGTGFKIFARGSLPANSRCSISDYFGPGTKIEFFDHARYFTVTGHHVPESPRSICGVQEAVDALIADAMAFHAKQSYRPRTDCSFEREPASGAPLEEKIRRARAWLRKAPPAIAGQRGHNQTFRAARAVVYGFDLDLEVAFTLLSEWNATCVPPWCEKDLWHKIHDADVKPFGKPRGYLLIERPSRRGKPKGQWTKPSKGLTQTGEDQTIDAAFDEALRRAERPEGAEAVSSECVELGERDPDTNRFVFSKNRVLPTANRFAEECFGHPDRLRLVHFRSEFWEWQSNHYRPIEDQRLRATLSPFLHEALQYRKCRDGRLELVPFDSNPKTVEDAMKTLASLAYVAGDTQMPSWLDSGRPPRPNPARMIACRDTLLDLSPFLASGNDPAKLRHTPFFFSANTFPYDYNLHAECPKWLEFLEHNLEKDEQRIRILQEWFGLNLLHDTSFQKCLAMEGEGANGKSVICCVLEALLGKDNCSAVPLECFGDKFALVATLGKLANVAAEVGELDKTAEGELKKFIAGDRMAFEPKFKPKFEAKPTARLTFSYNNRPSFHDRSGGMWRRLIVFPLRVTIPDNDPRRVRGMTSAEWWLSQGELPGVLNWALEGLRRLYLRREFTFSAVCDAAISQYRNDCNPARRFLEEYYQLVREPDGSPSHAAFVVKSEIHKEYVEWCRDRAHYPLSDSKFGKEVFRAFAGVGEERRTVPGRGRPTGYIGLRKVGQTW